MKRARSTLTRWSSAPSWPSVVPSPQRLLVDDVAVAVLGDELRRSEQAFRLAARDERELRVAVA